ncbi:sensor histidine kinase [Micromonospora endophytica]|uniref:histidine kinase n=1 Tax=Micromonospora endophytica TaxID=515350 RepID=A0A2W2BZI0_9ACTN|nr:histidine kinase [Micromonospora endophytica]PZF85844.1 two-component sensor histidine kinase [Micromonospora endophytica]RIW47711.1 sensor histidine kinase [Micromonospora endophytica]
MAGRANAWAFRPWGVDVLLGAGVAATVSVVITANEGGRHGPDRVAYLWAVGLGALMLARRRYPVAVLGVTVLGLFAYYAAGYPAVGLAVPVAAALFSAAEYGRLAAAVSVTVLVVVVSVGFRLAEGQDFSFVVGYELAGHVLLMGAAIALGDSVRSRRRAQADAQRIAELTEARYQQQADARVQQERISIARDLHDSLGHTTSVIALHADVAREALGRDDDVARSALELIRSTAGRSMADLRRTVTLLRSPDERHRTVVSLANLDAVTRAAHAAGFDVVLDVRVDDELPASVEAAAFRIVQEAITNVVRHSTGSRVEIQVRQNGPQLTLSVLDSGADQPSAGVSADQFAAAQVSDAQNSQTTTGPGGHGITGMRERAESLGGTLTAEPRAQGFLVRAVLPVEGAG